VPRAHAGSEEATGKFRDPPAGLQSACACARDLLQVRVAWLAVFTGGGQLVRSPALDGPTWSTVERAERLGYLEQLVQKSGILGAALLSGRPDEWQWSTALPGASGCFANALVAPLRREGELLGTLFAADRADGFRAGDLVTAKGLAGLLADCTWLQRPRAAHGWSGDAPGPSPEQYAETIAADRLRIFGEMASNLAHELNQPLVGVRGIAEHILLGLDRRWEWSEQRLREKVTRIIEQTDRITEIVNHLRQHARGAFRTERQLADLNAVVRRGADFVSPRLHSRGISLALELASDLPPIRINPAALEEVLFHLLANARDALLDHHRVPEGGSIDPASTVHVRTSREGAQGGWILVEVEDSAGGIPAEILPRVFEPFFTSRLEAGNTGLGLPVSRLLVERMGGQLALHTAQGSGTVATVRLAVASPDGQNG